MHTCSLLKTTHVRVGLRRRLLHPHNRKLACGKGRLAHIQRIPLLIWRSVEKWPHRKAEGTGGHRAGVQFGRRRPARALGRAIHGGRPRIGELNLKLTAPRIDDRNFPHFASDGRHPFTTGTDGATEDQAGRDGPVKRGVTAKRAIVL